MSLWLDVPITLISNYIGPDPGFFPFESRGEESAHNPLAMPSSIP